MKNKLFLTLFILTSSICIGQNINLTDYTIKPRLDSLYWEKDYETLNSFYSKAANHCQTCVSNSNDSIRGRFCFNTSLGHVQLDTNLQNIKTDKLIGTWEVVSYGNFEITDSIRSEFSAYYRFETILNEEKNTKDYITFSDKRMATDFKSAKDIPNKNKAFKIIDGKFLSTKKLGRFCGATCIGMTKDGFLILDDHTLRTKSKKGEYMLVKTSIRRIILKRNNDV